MIRSLHIIDTLGMGGAETWLMEVLRLWAERGNAQMDFLVSSGQRGIFDSEAERLGAKIHYLAFGRNNFLPFALAFRRLLKGGCYDALHDHQDYASGWHYMLGGELLPPVRVTHVHNPSYQIRNNYGVTLGRRVTARIGKALVAKYATHIAGTSRQVISEYGFDDPSFATTQKLVLHCGFDTRRFAGARNEVRTSLLDEFGWPHDAFVALFAGRIDASPDPAHPQTHKNAGFAVDVAIAAASRDTRLRLLLAGAPSSATPVLEQRAAQAGLSNAIRFLGLRRDIERLMLGSDVLLFPSRGEGLGMVAVEAQASGLPVLASDAVPSECVVVPSLVCFKSLAEGPMAWADDLIRLATASHDSSANAKVAASPFAIEHSARAMLDLYRSARSDDQLRL